MSNAVIHNPVLSVLWLLVGITTIIFAARGLVALLPSIPFMRRHRGLSGASAVSSMAAVAAGVIVAAGGVPGLPANPAAVYRLPPAPYPAAPLANDASAGKVVFTFDDGPGIHTGQVIAELNALHVHGVFFVTGKNAAAHPEIIRALVANGEVVGNHTWDHKSMTGKGTGTRPLSQAQVRDELSRADAAVVMAGAPKPSLWRPPYGGVSLADEKTAQTLGLRVVLDSGTNIVESDDWAGLTAQQIGARVEPRLKNGTIISFHDGVRQAPQMIKALPLIVSYMNAHHLGATTAVRADATGGVVPYLGPSPAKHAPAASAPVAPPASRAAATVPPAFGPARFTQPPAPASTSQARTSPASRRPASAPAHANPAPAPAHANPAPAPTHTSPKPPPPSTPPPSTPAPPPTTPAPPDPAPAGQAPVNQAPAEPAPADPAPAPAPVTPPPASSGGQS